MKNANLDKTVVFIDKKAEYERKNKISKLHLDKLHGKNKIIGYKEHKKTKAHEVKKKKLLNSKLYKSRKIIILAFILILSMLIILSLWNKFYKVSYTTSDNHNFKVENQNISNSDASVYSSIIKESVQKNLNIKYNIKIEQLHKNGKFIFSKGYFTIPKKGNINFDMVLQNYSPYSLKVNGEEYIKK
ncbi:hypothetical protein [Terrisporobacter sp.]